MNTEDLFPQEAARHHALEAERLLEEGSFEVAAIKAAAHASLACYYAQCATDDGSPAASRLDQIRDALRGAA